MLLLSPGAALALDEKGEDPTGAILSKGVLNYDDCVHIALHNSPYFVESALEVELKRLDEADARWDMLPTIMLTTNYKLRSLENARNKKENPWYLGFSASGYDPIRSYFTIPARKKMTRIAVYEHLRNIAEGLYNLGVAYMRLGYLEKMDSFQDELIDLAEKEKVYATNRYKNGWATTLEVLIADQKIVQAQLNKDKGRALKAQAEEELKLLLGVDPATNLNLDLDDLQPMLIGDFDAESLTMDQIRSNNIELKIQSLKKQLRKANIKLAYAKFLPTFTLGINTESLASTGDNTLVSSIGVKMPLLDWGARFRNVSRSKREFEKTGAETNLKKLELDKTWRLGLSKIDNLTSAFKLTQADSELAGLKKQQSEISYKSGTLSFPEYLSAISEHINTRIAALQKELEHDESVFRMRYLSGHLHTRYVDAMPLR